LRGEAPAESNQRRNEAGVETQGGRDRKAFAAKEREILLRAKAAEEKHAEEEGYPLKREKAVQKEKGEEERESSMGGENPFSVDSQEPGERPLTGACFRDWRGDGLDFRPTALAFMLGC